MSLFDDVIVEVLGLLLKCWKKCVLLDGKKAAWVTFAFVSMFEFVIREMFCLYLVVLFVVCMFLVDVSSVEMMILKGCVVGVWLSLVYRDDAVWDRSEEFDLKRWIVILYVWMGLMGSFMEDSEEDLSLGLVLGKFVSGFKYKGVGYMSFAYGFRSCVG